jgi:porin
LDLGRALADKGIYLTGRTLQQGMDLTSGGLRRGALYEGFNLFGFDLDMNKIAGDSGGSFHFLINDLAGLNPGLYTGSTLVYNRAGGAYPDEVRLNEMSYEHTFLDGKLDVRVGRLRVGSEFDSSQIYCEFLYGICSTPGMYIQAKGYGSYLASTWGGVAAIQLPRHFYFNLGAYEDEPSIATAGHLGFPGEDWAPDKARGVTIPMQLGYKTTAANDPYPRAYSIGGMINTGDYSDPSLNSKGLNRALYGGSARLDHGKTSIWVQAEQTIWRPDPATNRSLVLLGGANFITSGYTAAENGIFGGFSFRGPLAARPNDSLNLLGQYYTLTSDYVDYRNAAVSKTVNPGLSSHTSSIELNYGVAVAPGAFLKPDITYIWNPDEASVSKPVGTVRHALIIGLAFSALLDESLGLPRLSHE